MRVATGFVFALRQDGIASDEHRYISLSVGLVFQFSASLASFGIVADRSTVPRVHVPRADADTGRRILASILITAPQPPDGRQEHTLIYG